MSLKFDGSDLAIAVERVAASSSAGMEQRMIDGSAWGGRAEVSLVPG